MKGMLVVLVGGLNPMPTDIIFDKLSDCFSAEEQQRRAFIEALEARDKRALASFERRRDYVRARGLQARRFNNSSTCIPHSGGDPITSSRVSGQPPLPATSQRTVPPSSTPVLPAPTR